MKMTMKIECDCGHLESVNIEKSFVDEMLTISSSINEHSTAFTARQSHPDEITVTCASCGKNEDLCI